MPMMDVFGYNIVAEDLTKPAVTSAVAGTTRLEQAQTRLGAAMRTGSREMTLLASGISHMGMTLMLASSVLGDTTGVLGQAGMAMAMLGSGVSTVVPLLKTMKVVMYGELLPAIYGYVTALWAAYAAEIVVTGGIALVLGAVAAYYLSTRKNTDASKDETGAVKNQTDAYDDLNSKMWTAAELKDRMKGISENLAGAELDLQEATLDQSSAEKAWNETLKGTDEDEQKRSWLRLMRANLRVKKAKEAVDTLGTKLTETEKTPAWADIVSAFGPQIPGPEVLGAGVAEAMPGEQLAPTGMGEPSRGEQTGPVFYIENVNLAKGDTLQEWVAREGRQRSGVPTL